MGVDVVLAVVEQRGTSPKRRRVRPVDTVVDTTDGFARLCASSHLPTLRRVDPYGTLVLTPPEMGQLISEIELARVKDASFSRWAT
ncbi:hypothetical protein [Halostreptopolyspora alba]|uniref:Uncharacterized protein n=1 Tax=Halostreptopolyspora alba TaxID=2487137 RepID=A0A3N0EAL1_9ACTN|nr:hypothetical protein EFW17_11140 [Nocardiopsaceae bacterium YIM 96095]